MDPALQIPDELSACQALLGEFAQTITELSAKLVELQQENAEHQLTIQELLLACRRRSERYLEDPNQLRLDFGDTPEAADAAEGLCDALAQAEIVAARADPRLEDDAVNHLKVVLDDDPVFRGWIVGDPLFSDPEAILHRLGERSSRLDKP